MHHTWRYWRSNTSNLHTHNTFGVNFSSPPPHFSPKKKKNDKRPLTPRTPPRSRTPVEASVLNVGGSGTSSTSSASGGGGELLSGRGRTDVVRRRISQQHAKLCGVLQKNGRLRVFHSAGKEECFVPVQSVMSTFFLFF